MKKILALFALCAMFVACGGSSSEPTMESRCDNYAKKRKEICDAGMERYEIVGADRRTDKEFLALEEKFEKLNDEFSQWLYSLPDEERRKAVDYLQESYEKYPSSDFPW